MSIDGAYIFSPRIHADLRGEFHEFFRADLLAEATGHRLPVVQANFSVSKRGALRGIHFADVPPGQAKYIICAYGRIMDVVVDLRVGSPTYGRHEKVRLDEETHRGLYLAEGLGHGVMALTDHATIIYLCSAPHDPTHEHGVHPLDPEIGIAWPDDIELLLSPKDAAAPGLKQARASGLLPDYEKCLDFYATRNAPG